MTPPSKRRTPRRVREAGEALPDDRRFSYIPRFISLDASLSDGAIVLYTTLAALGDVAMRHGELGHLIGVSRRSILTWAKDLGQIDGVMIEHLPRQFVRFDLGNDIKTVIAEADFGRVPLLGWGNSATWTMPMRRAWIAIWSYCGGGFGCFVGVETLANKCGRQPRAMQRTLRYLTEARLLRIRYHRRMSSDLLPFDGKRFVAAKDRKGGKQTTDLESERVKEPTMGGKQMTRGGEANDPGGGSTRHPNSLINRQVNKIHNSLHNTSTFVDGVRRRRLDKFDKFQNGETIK